MVPLWKLGSFYITHIGNTNTYSPVWSSLLTVLFWILGVIVALLGSYVIDAFAKYRGIDD